MVNEQKTTDAATRNVIPARVFGPYLPRAVAALSEDPKRAVYIGDNGKPEAVVINIDEYERLLTIDADSQAQEVSFQNELRDRKTSSHSAADSERVDDVDAWASALGIDRSATSSTTGNEAVDS